MMGSVARRGRGILVVFEGCDRSGKSTQCKMLVDYLKSIGKDVAHLRFPDRTTAIGQSINGYLQGTTELEDHAIHLLFSANRWESEPRIKKLLDNGTFVVVDRYAFSGVAFTAAKGYNVTWCKNPDRGLPDPDLIFYLDISTKDAQTRGSYGEERYEKIEFQERVAEVYKQLKTKDWKVLDAMKDKSEIHEEIRNTLLKLEEKFSKAPLKRLWTDES
ncbi:thymidylate kinase-like [Stylophora pistillata]|uniref:Thymidylate kinase n=1 Tax=Stylophora pistillata TaxID=50429 RepID=A0A2B4SYD0_STYPI|nr:thymidylate kinase-like [Stylophora pistillata]PFX33890.1 Thymidylate kinase [Stylophora pistillata]